MGQVLPYMKFVKSLSKTKVSIIGKKLQQVLFVSESLALITWIVMSNSSEACAYTDPGSGAFLMQTVLAAVTGGLFFFKTIRSRIASFFHRSKKSSAQVDSQKNP